MAFTGRIDDLRDKLEELSYQGPLTVGTLDIDCFEDLNRKYGRDCGDTVLVFAGSLLRKNLPENTYITRTGDEFFVYSTEYRSENILMELEEIRKTIAEWTTTCNGVPVKVTVSGTVAEMPRNASTVEKLLNLLSEGLRMAKKQGRNRVLFAPSEKEQKMVMKTNYYLRSQLDKLSKLARITERTESSLLREALDDLLRKYEL